MSDTELDERQVTCFFTTKLPKEFRVPDESIGESLHVLGP